MSEAYTPKELTRGGWVVLSLVASLGLASQFIGYRSSWGAIGSPFWDYEVYRYALDRFNDNLNPYVIGPNGWSFVYPPIFLRAFSVFSFAIVYPTMIAILVVLSVYKLSGVGRATPLFILGFLTGGAGYVAVLTGNITVFAHLFLVSACYAAFKRDGSDWAAVTLSAAAIFFSAIKIYFLPYILVLAIIPRRRIGLVAVVIAGTLAIYASQIILDRDLWNKFQMSLYGATLANGDTGYSLYFLLFKLTGSSILSIGLYEIALLGIFLGYVANQTRSILSFVIRSSSDLFAVLAFVIALNPRLKEYDICLLMACVYLSAAMHSRRDMEMLIYGLATFSVAAMALAKILFLLGIDKVGEYFTGGVLFACAYTIPIYVGLMVLAVANRTTDCSKDCRTTA